MKKFFTVMAPILIMIGVAAICILIYMFFTNKLPKFQQGQTLQQNLPNLVSDVVLTEDELPVLDATTIVQPLMTGIVRNFTENDNIKIEKNEKFNSHPYF